MNLRRISSSLLGFLLVSPLLESTLRSQNQTPQQPSTDTKPEGPPWAYLSMPGTSFDVGRVARKGQYYMSNDLKVDTKLYFLPPLVQLELNTRTHTYCARSEASDKSTITYRCVL